MLVNNLTQNWAEEFGESLFTSDKIPANLKLLGNYNMIGFTVMNAFFYSSDLRSQKFTSQVPLATNHRAA